MLVLPRGVEAASLTITRDATSITTDNGTVKLVTKNCDVAFGKQLYHTSINNGQTPLVGNSGSCGDNHDNLAGFWAQQTPTAFQLLESTPTRAKILNSNANQGVSWVTWGDAKSYVHMWWNGTYYYNLAEEVGVTSNAPQVQTFDGTNQTWLLSDTTNNNFAGINIEAWTPNDFGNGGWGDDGIHSSGYGWVKNTGTSGTVLFDLSHYRSTASTVTSNMQDYRNPADFSGSLSKGSGWFDANEYSVGTSDFFNEQEGAYVLNADNIQIDLTINGGTYNRLDPAFKIRNWRSQDDPAQVTVGGVTQTKGTNYNDDILPFSEAWFYANSGSVYTQLADAGYTGSDNEYLNSATKNYTISFAGNQDYIAFGSTSKFRGININLNRNGSGSSPTITWEYWNGAAWAGLGVSETVTGVSNLTTSGTVYWSSDPTSWTATSLNSGRTLFYVRGRLTSGTYSTTPIESRITTDILLFQYLGTISTDSTEIFISHDNTPPTISAIGETTPTNDSTPTFTGTATDDYGTVSMVDYQVGATTSGGWANCSGSFNTSPVSFSCTVSPALTEGSYTVYFRATDSNGNTTSAGNYQTASLVVDLTRPTTNASGVGVSGHSSGDWLNAAPTITWTAGADNGGGSGIFGYCLALEATTIGSGSTGTSTHLDPATTGGALAGLDDGIVQTYCPFMTTYNSLNVGNIAGLTLTSGKEYYLSIKAVDQAGNVWSGDSSLYQDVAAFRYDNQLPTNPSGLSAPQTYKNSLSDFTIYWATSGVSAAKDNDSGIKGYQYQINDGKWYGTNHSGAEDCNDVLSPSTGSYTLDSNYDTLSTNNNGENTFRLRTWDNTCNVTTTYITAVLKYSGNAPSEPNSLTATPATNTDNSFAFSWTIPTTYSGLEGGLTYCYTVNAHPSALLCTGNWMTGTSLAAAAFATQYGANFLDVVAKDEAGNVNYGTYAEATFTANTSAPGAPRNTDVSDISIKSTSNWKLAVSWDAPTSVGSGIATYKVYRSATANAVCATTPSAFSVVGSTSGTTYTDTGLTQKTYYYCVTACDSANNCSAYSTTASKYPTGRYTSAASLTSGPGASSITTKKAKITWSTDRSSDSKVEYGTSSNSYQDEEPSNSSQVTDHTINLTNLTPGKTYYYRAKWTDEDGNTGTSDEKSFATQAAPSVSSVKESDISLSSALITMTVDNASKATIFYGKTSAYGGASSMNTATSESTYSVKLTKLDDGTTYHYMIELEDADGNKYDFEDHQFATLPRPTVSDIKIQQVINTAQPTILVSWNSNTELSSIITYYPDGMAGSAQDQVNLTMIKGLHQMIIKGLSDDTRYVLVVKGRDKVGNEADSDVQVFTTATDTRPPMISDLTIESKAVPPVSGAAEEISSQLLVSWTTDEPATSQIEFSEGAGDNYSQKSQKDLNLTLNHLVIVSSLTPSKVYHLRAISLDKAGNESHSSDMVTITAKGTDNALNLVFSNLQQAFGFIGPLSK
ncbi:fibronectin type III domain-containing protein [Patescibacteria group bacterium]|nr:fibronectin type III domain-containing protein [Patescibacteria group bacterium]